MLSRVKKIIIVFLLIFTSCSYFNMDKVQTKKIVKTYLNKRFESDLIIPTSDKFTIVIYVDSCGCTECYLHPIKWKLLERGYGNNYNLLIISNIYESKMVKALVSRDKVKCKLITDKNNSFKLKNKIPENRMFHVFLLDNNKYIRIVGDPMLSTKLMDLYESYFNKRILNKYK